MTIMMKGGAKTLEGLRKSKKNVRTIGVPAETRTGHLRNTRVDPRAIVRLEGLGKLNKSTLSGLDPTTFRLVA
jgi:hypothetical protein